MAELNHSTLLPWHEGIWPDLVAAAAKGGGVLLSGASGHGKHWLARRFAQALLCETPLAGLHPCGHCPGCQLFKVNQHPDYAEIVPESRHDDFIRLRTEASDGSEDKEAKETRASREIRVRDIRALNQLMALSAHRGGRRVVLIWPADDMNLSAANALLKVLEEPGEGLQFLLVAAHPARLIPTIRSRINVVNCPPSSSAQAQAWLTRQGVDQADAALGLSVGAPLNAMALIRDAGRVDNLQERSAFARFLLDMAAGQTAERSGSVDKMGLGTLLQILMLVAADVLRLHQGVPAVHLAYMAEPMSRIRLADPRGLHELIAQALQLMPQADHPLNVRVQLEPLLQRWQSCFIRKAA